MSIHKKVCTVEGCFAAYSAKGYCQRHYYQIAKYGHITHVVHYLNELPERTPTIEGDVVKIPLNNSLTVHTVIDKSDYKLVHSRWYLSSNGYASSSRGVLLHRIVANAPRDKLVDHIDGDKLNNVKSNLRLCDKSENGRNRFKTVTNTSGYKGVTYDKRLKKYCAQLKINYKRIYLGLYTDPICAAKAYDEAVDKYFDGFGTKNFS